MVGSSHRSLCHSHCCPPPGNWGSSRTCWQCHPTRAAECGPACAHGSPLLSPVHLQYQTAPGEEENRRWLGRRRQRQRQTEGKLIKIQIQKNKDGFILRIGNGDVRQKLTYIGKRKNRKKQHETQPNKNKTENDCCHSQVISLRVILQSDRTSNLGVCKAAHVTCWSSGVQIPQVIWLSKLISEDQCLCPLTEPTRTKPSR